MDFIGGVAGMNFAPITNYNSLLKNNKSFDIDSGSDFENVLNQQTMALQNQTPVKGGVELNNFDDVMNKMAVTSPQGVQEAPTAGNFMDSISNSIKGGLNTVNDNVKAADRAQEAFAMGENISAHDVMIAAEKANLSLSMAMQLRNKLLSAYTEINNVKV